MEICQVRLVHKGTSPISAYIREDDSFRRSALVGFSLCLIWLFADLCASRLTGSIEPSPWSQCSAWDSLLQRYCGVQLSSRQLCENAYDFSSCLWTPCERFRCCKPMRDVQPPQSSSVTRRLSRSIVPCLTGQAPWLQNAGPFLKRSGPSHKMIHVNMVQRSACKRTRYWLSYARCAAICFFPYRQNPTKVDHLIDYDS